MICIVAYLFRRSSIAPFWLCRLLYLPCFLNVLPSFMMEWHGRGRADFH
jgi:hypothetical protein